MRWIAAALGAALALAPLPVGGGEAQDFLRDEARRAAWPAAKSKARPRVAIHYRRIKRLRPAPAPAQTVRTVRVRYAPLHPGAFAMPAAKLPPPEEQPDIVHEPWMPITLPPMERRRRIIERAPEPEPENWKRALVISVVSVGALATLAAAPKL